MTLPLSQIARIGAYTLTQHIKGGKYPLVLMLEPLFRCNLACPGCGKIDYPDAILNQRLSFEQCMEAIDDCGAPAVSIAGGEPLLHRDMPKIVRSGIDQGVHSYVWLPARKSRNNGELVKVQSLPPLPRANTLRKNFLVRSRLKKCS